MTKSELVRDDRVWQSHSSIKISHKAQTSIEFEFRIFFLKFLNLKPSSQLGLGLGLRCLAFCSRVRYQFGIVSVTKGAGQWRVAGGVQFDGSGPLCLKRLCWELERIAAIVCVAFSHTHTHTLCIIYIFIYVCCGYTYILCGF